LELKRENIRLTLLTTGLLLNKYVTQVTDIFDDVIVSLDGPERVHDAIRRVEGGFTLIRLGLGALKQRRPKFPITARTTVQKANHRYLRETVRAAKLLGFDGISFLAADITSEAFNRHESWSLERQSEVALTSQELDALAEEVEALIHEHSSDINTGYIAESAEKLRRITRHFRAHLGLDEATSPACNAPWVSAVMETDGTVRPCFFHRSIGNARTSSLENLVNGEAALAFRSALDIGGNPVCKRCVCSLNYQS
jgi:MoaA/NifB/PqqE/SkfB family radical SAM enzyme